MKTLLFDGDIILYHAAAANEVALEVEPDYWTWHCDTKKVKEAVTESIDYYMDLLEADDFIFCLSDDSSNFRKDVLPTYKMHRKKVKRPLGLKPAREWVQDRYKAIIWPSLEADDLVGILSTEPQETEQRIIVSGDKDLKTIPGWFYRDAKTGLVKISEEEADYFHLLQTITGDSTDGYSGIPGAGPAAAKKALDKDCSWSTVASMYKAKSLTKEYALSQARCARILRWTDYDHVNRKPILWRPT